MIGSEIAGAMLRGLHLAALASLFGTLVFSILVLQALPGSSPLARVQAQMALLARASAAVALVSGIAWFVERGAAMAGAGGFADALVALPTVAGCTRFGHLLVLRGVLVLVLSALLGHRRAWPVATLLAGLALGLQAATSHAGAIVGVPGQRLVFAEVLHILAAVAWLGALVPLLLTLVAIPASSAVPLLRRFFPLGVGAVLVVGATSLFQATYLVGSIPALIGTAYGQITLLKFGLFLLLLAFAVMNRFVFGAAPGASLRKSIAGEVVVAAMLMLAAGSLAYLTPGAHAQPVWPFAWRINPEPAGALLVPANPNSYFASPTGFAAAAIVRGEGIYQSACAGCHGASAKGDGDLARTLTAAPADLTARRLLEFSDGDLYWRVGHEAALSEDARWDLVDFFRAHNHGAFVHTSGRRLVNLRIPRFSATCPEGRSLSADDMRGQVLRIIVPGPDQEAPGSSPAVQVATFLLSAGVHETCLAQGDALPAFAILLGGTQSELAGAQFLIDPNGWLRGYWRPGEPGGWGTPELLLARAQTLAQRPLPLGADTQPHRH
jgi:putative copper export protein